MIFGYIYSNIVLMSYDVLMSYEQTNRSKVLATFASLSLHCLATTPCWFRMVIFFLLFAAIKVALAPPSRRSLWGPATSCRCEQRDEESEEAKYKRLQT